MKRKTATAHVLECALKHNAKSDIAALLEVSTQFLDKILRGECSMPPRLSSKFESSQANWFACAAAEDFSYKYQKEMRAEWKKK